MSPAFIKYKTVDAVILNKILKSAQLVQSYLMLLLAIVQKPRYMKSYSKLEHQMHRQSLFMNGSDFRLLVLEKLIIVVRLRMLSS